MSIAGTERLRGARPDRVVLLGRAIDADRIARLREVFPQATIANVGEDIPRSGAQALLVARRARWDAVVVLDNERKLKALALAMRAPIRLMLVDDRLDPLGARELVAHQVAASPLLRHARRSLVRPKPRATRFGLGNDYSALGEPALHRPHLRVSVVVPVYNRRPIVTKTLAGLRHQSYPRELFEVIIADDGSHDHPEALIDEHAGALDIRIVRQEDLGFRAARVRNLGIAAARGDIVVLLDGDMLPAPELLTEHLRWFHATSLPLVTIGMRKFVDTTGIDATDVLRDADRIRRLPPRPSPMAIRDPDDATADWRLRAYDATDELRFERRPYRFAASGNLAMRRADVLAAGLFDEAYERWGGEDEELAYRLYRRGAYFVPVRAALAYHQEHADGPVREEDQKTTRRMNRSRIPFGRRESADETFEVAKVALVVLVPAPSSDPSAVVEAALAQGGVSTHVVVAGPAVRDDDRVTVVRAEDALLDRAIEATRAEYAMILAPRDAPPPDLAATLVAPLEEDPRVALATSDGLSLVRIRDLFRLRALEPNAPWTALARYGTVRQL